LKLRHHHEKPAPKIKFVFSNLSLYLDVASVHGLANSGTRSAQLDQEENQLLMASTQKFSGRHLQGKGLPKRFSEGLFTGLPRGASRGSTAETR